MAFAIWGGQISLFDSATGELIETVHGHGSSIFGLGFSPDGRRLISSAGGREAVKLWDVSTRQELLTLLALAQSWSEPNGVPMEMLSWPGAPWQAWTAPSWEEIARAGGERENGDRSAINTNGEVVCADAISALELPGARDFWSILLSPSRRPHLTTIAALDSHLASSSDF